MTKFGGIRRRGDNWRMGEKEGKEGMREEVLARVVIRQEVKATQW